MKKSETKYIEKSHPSEWFLIADELQHSAIALFDTRNNSIMEQRNSVGETLFQKPTISRAYFLLAGFSLENLIKGLLITENSSLIKDGKIDKSISSGHNILNLAKKLNCITLTPIEIELLEILSEALPYWSRYPIPKTYNHLAEEVAVNNNIHNTYIELFEKLKRNLIELSSTDWTDPSGKITSWSTKSFN